MDHVDNFEGLYGEEEGHVASIAEEPMGVEHPCIQAVIPPFTPGQFNTPQTMCIPAPSTSVNNEPGEGQLMEEDISRETSVRTTECVEDERDIHNECAVYEDELNAGLCEDKDLSEAGDVSTQECEFTRKEMCKTHKIKGNGMEVKSKKWKKKKFDNSWVTTTMVRYSCSLDSVRQMEPENTSQIQHSDLSPGYNVLISKGDYLAHFSSNLIGQDEVKGLESVNSIKR